MGEKKPRRGGPTTMSEKMARAGRIPSMYQTEPLKLGPLEPTNPETKMWKAVLRSLDKNGVTSTKRALDTYQESSPGSRPGTQEIAHLIRVECLEFVDPRMRLRPGGNAFYEREDTRVQAEATPARVAPRAARSTAVPLTDLSADMNAWMLLAAELMRRGVSRPSLAALLDAAAALSLPTQKGDQ